MTFFTEQDTNRNKTIPLSPECGTLKNDGCRRIHFPEIIRSHHMISAKPINDVYHMHDSYELLLFWAAVRTVTSSTTGIGYSVGIC